MNSNSVLRAEELENIFGERPAGAEAGYNYFSVLVPVVAKEEGLYVLYEVRAKHMQRQPGEICFPGGKMEPEETALECALRETYEEIGIEQHKVKVINQLDTIYTYSNFLMYCFLGIIEEDALADIKLNPDEVDEVFLVSLDELLGTEPEVYKMAVAPEVPEDFPYEKVSGGKPYNWRKGKVIVPIYNIGQKVIWGLTARITKRFTDVIRGERCLK